MYHYKRLSIGPAQDVKNSFSDGEYHPKTPFSAAFLLLFRNKKKPRTEKCRVFAYLFHSRKIGLLQNQQVMQSDFAGCKTFSLSSTTPPCAETAIASLEASGICRTGTTKYGILAVWQLPLCRCQRLTGNVWDFGNCLRKSPDTWECRG